jgi:hypothetical protein
MNHNRELGIITTAAAIIKTVNRVVAHDFSDCKAATDCRNYN